MTDYAHKLGLTAGACVVNLLVLELWLWLFENEFSKAGMGTIASAAKRYLTLLPFFLCSSLFSFLFLPFFLLPFLCSDSLFSWRIEKKSRIFQHTSDSKYYKV